MIDAIAHQWRQPLAQSNMILFNIQEELDESNISNQYITDKIVDIINLNQYMSKTIDDYRGLLSEDRDKREFVVEEAIDDTLTLMAESLKGIKIGVKRAKHTVDGYKSELIQLLIILISNTIEAFESRDVEDRAISIDVISSSDTISISIEDNAGGIPLSSQEKIFDPYYTTKVQSGGTGLGLYIAKIITDSIGGDIWYERVDSGSKFMIKIPI